MGKFRISIGHVGAVGQCSVRASTAASGSPIFLGQLIDDLAQCQETIVSLVREWTEHDLPLVDVFAFATPFQIRYGLF